MPSRTKSAAKVVASPHSQESASKANSAYRIAAVAKLTGMPVPTIRMWERRYGVVTPARSAANGRLYSRADIDRLILLKSVADAGHAIGTVAQLSEPQLQARLLEGPGRSTALPAGLCRVLVCGAALAGRLDKAWTGRSDVQITTTLPQLSAELQPMQSSADAVIVEAATLQSAPIRSLRQLRLQTRAKVMIVVYGFGNRQALARLDQEGIIALALPAEPAHLARICLLGSATDAAAAHDLNMQPLQALSPRRYDESFLATVAQLPTTVRCECPHHLADLLTKLNAFEQYSLECENSDQADVSIHSLLYTTTAQCRQWLEQALHRVLLHEGIADPTAAPAPAAARR
ncbi:MAG: MerR family transcriptional regulator [Pseudomonadota bacterium]